MKYCIKCEEDKPEDSFSWRSSKRKEKRRSYCKSCQRKYAREHYEKNKEKYKNRARECNAKQRNILRKFVWSYLHKNPCVDCGESDPVVLEFDHRMPEEKEFNIGYAVSSCYSLDRIKCEIAKCDIRCCNCHRRKTHRQFSYWEPESNEQS